jgi:hypothetical protein
MATPSNPSPLEIPNPGGVHEDRKIKPTPIQHGMWAKSKKRLADLMKQGIKEKKQQERENS